ncbi:unnamed protein product [Onchocerca flexuosa]|nr:unnamed protein product [Onchocerca flexuosa]
MEETYVMNECKEDICFVADDFVKHMEIAKCRGKENTIVRDYVLPDFNAHNRGFMRAPEDNVCDDLQKLRVNVERFAVPEALFSPSDIGISQMGIPEAIATAVKKCPYGMRGRLLNNIVLCGGNVLFPGFKKRVVRDLRPFVDQIYDVQLRDIADPITYAWYCGRNAVKLGAWDNKFVSKAEYNEHGPVVWREKFFNFLET